MLLNVRYMSEKHFFFLNVWLWVIIRGQTITDEVLWTVLIETEEILNSKPLGYVSSDVVDPDPIT